MVFQAAGHDRQGPFGFQMQRLPARDLFAKALRAEAREDLLDGWADARRTVPPRPESAVWAYTNERVTSRKVTGRKTANSGREFRRTAKNEVQAVFLPKRSLSCRRSRPDCVPSSSKSEILSRFGAFHACQEPILCLALQSTLRLTAGTLV